MSKLTRWRRLSIGFTRNTAAFYAVVNNEGTEISPKIIGYYGERTKKVVRPLRNRDRALFIQRIHALRAALPRWIRVFLQGLCLVTFERNPFKFSCSSSGLMTRNPT